MITHVLAQEGIKPGESKGMNMWICDTVILYVARDSEFCTENDTLTNVFGQI